MSKSDAEFPRDFPFGGVVRDVRRFLGTHFEKPPTPLKMNTPIRRLVLSLAAAAVALALLPTQAGSPKGAQRLAGLTAASGERSTSLMSCTGCDSRATHTTTAARGQRIASVTSTHGCASCTSSITAAGHGKSKVQVVRHSCSMTSAAATGCCASNSGSSAAR